MRKYLTFLITVLVLSLCAASAGAITNGQKDTEDRYPFVGMLAFYDDSGAYMYRCTGTLIASNVVLTASHCTDGTSSARAYFDVEVIDDYRNNVGGANGMPYTHPDYNPRTLNNDVAVVILSERMDVASPYPVLPEVGFLSQMKRTHEIQDDSFVAVGYGGVPAFPPSIIDFDLFRRVASSPYGSLNRNNLHLQQNPNPDGAGGTCFGDSGGPRFWEDSLTLVAVTSWGDAICRSNDRSQRLDIPSTRDFVLGFLADS